MEENQIDTHYHCYVIELNGDVYEMGVRCEPAEDDPKTIEMGVITRAPVSKEEVPEVVVDEFRDFLEGVRKSYHQKYLMTLP
jgi:hypothetical protein